MSGTIFLLCGHQSVVMGRRSWVNFGARYFCPKIYVRKINKMPEFYIIFARKITEFPNCTRYLSENGRILCNICPKMHEFLHDICRNNIFFRFFFFFGGGGTCQSCTPSPTPMVAIGATAIKLKNSRFQLFVWQRHIMFLMLSWNWGSA